MKISGTIVLEGIIPSDIEDITIGHSSNNYIDSIYLADTGNNNGWNRTESYVYRFIEPNSTEYRRYVLYVRYI